MTSSSQRFPNLGSGRIIITPKVSRSVTADELAKFLDAHFNNLYEECGNEEMEAYKSSFPGCSHCLVAKTYNRRGLTLVCMSSEMTDA